MDKSIGPLTRYTYRSFFMTSRSKSIGVDMELVPLLAARKAFYKVLEGFCGNFCPFI